jgi:hypothetical protein
MNKSRFNSEPGQVIFVNICSEYFHQILTRHSVKRQEVGIPFVLRYSDDSGFLDPSLKRFSYISVYIPALSEDF